LYILALRFVVLSLTILHVPEIRDSNLNPSEQLRRIQATDLAVLQYHNFFFQSFADFHFVEDMSHIYAPNQGYPSSSICPTQPRPLDSPLTPHFSECFFYASVLVEHESWL